MAEAAPPNIEFIAFHKPVLTDGKYTIEVTQSIKHNGIGIRDSIEFEITKTATFQVAGEQYVLNPRDIIQVFPPAGSIADHSNVFPHVVLNRSTLPWERSNGSVNETGPWLALLLFSEAETEKVTVEVSTLGGANVPLSEEIGQKTDDKLTLVKVPRDILKKIMPEPKELEFLTHVRQGTDAEENPVGNEKAVVIGNRLPKKGEESTVHLVSLEKFKFDWENQPDQIQLVSLKSWKFSCPDHYKVTQEALDRLPDQTTATKLRPLEGNEYYKEATIKAAFDELKLTYGDDLLERFHFGTFTQTLLHLNRNPSTLRLPKKSNPAVDSFLQAGFVPMPHHFRKGAKSVSWYHGPLATGKPSETGNGFEFPAKTSDQLLRYDSDKGMFDVSYAAAWELGRLLALANKRFSTELFQWKRRHTHDIRAAEQTVIHDSGHLPSSPSGTPSLELPKTVADGFDDLALLKGVPFNYLVPEEAMLPVESIRFFSIDILWMRCLLDGAFSIGRVTAADHGHDTARKEDLDYPARSGFLMRSDVISGWPDMGIEAYGGPEDSKVPLRLHPHQTTLSENVVLCIFDGEIDRVVMHLKPETIHFGVDVTADGTTYQKEKRPPLSQKEKRALPSGSIVALPFKPKADRAVDITALAAKMGASNAAEFGYQMVEGVEKVVFERNQGN